MRITKVTYSRLHSFGNYENETVGAEAEVGEEDNAVECLEAVRSWVDTQLLGNKVSRCEAGMTQAELQEARRQLVAMNEQAQAYREAGAKLQEALIEIGNSGSPAAKALVAAFDQFEREAPRELPF